VADKSAVEWAALKMVYAVADFGSVEKHEEPDFLLQHHPNSDPFGVEVTQVFRTDSDARMINHPSYISDLLAGADHLHKDDVSEFGVVEVTITAPDGTVKDTGVPAIIRETPSQAEQAASIEAALRKKEARTSDYLQACSHVNLILLDRYDEPYCPDSEYSVGRLITPGMRLALLSTDFREVYLISQSTDGDPVIRPLRMLLLMESFYGFVASLESYDGNLPNSGDHSWIFPAFHLTASSVGLNVSLAGWPEHPEAIFGGSGITTSDDGIRVRDYRDFPIPDPSELPGQALDDIDIVGLTSHFEAFIANHEFVCGMVLPVEEQPELPGLSRRTIKNPEE
jgi:hypothetical protein